ncbi:MAG: YgeY family selenium metabolism-linked hydrolase [Deltaproteobacteria bacterium]|nr:YgeY family selenium metabolism-linked hydrolase [Deltaproteobacteria bacterium]
MNAVAEIRRKVKDLGGEAVEFLSDLVRTRSLSGDEGDVVRLVSSRMKESGFKGVDVDRFGNVRGVIGDKGPLIAFDAHLDTVDVGNPDNWDGDPFSGDVRDGSLHGRGASDQKAGMAAIVYAGKVLSALDSDLPGFDLPFRFMGVGSVQEEDCDGLCWQFLVREDGLRPDCVVLTEPTMCNVYRGHRGRMEITVTVAGVSAHGSAPERGVNAIYRMADILKELEALNDRLTEHPFLGKGSLTVSQITSTSPSLCAVADSACIHVDRRLTMGETRQSAVDEIANLPSVRRWQGRVDVLTYDKPTHTGFVLPTDKYYPTWLLDEGHPALDASRRTLDGLGMVDCGPGRWTFSTNGVATAGMFGIPTLGFGPGDERQAHAPNERCAVEQISRAIEFYALFGFELAAGVGWGDPDGRR